MSTLRVLIAPDSFKGSADAADVAEALAAGWRAGRPGDELILLPQADGGEGTCAVVATALPGSTWRAAGLVEGPDGRGVPARWLRLPDGSAVIELADSCGLPLMQRPDPGGAGTHGLGEVIRAAITDGAHALRIGLGGSASTDGGAGALSALGARLLDERGRLLPPGGTALARLHHIDISELLPPPAGGVELLVDTRAVLTGTTGAAQVFGPQKGASPTEVAALDAALAHFATVLDTVLPGDPGRPGAGAAGGTGFGLASWGARIADGATRLAELTGLADALPDCDIVVTGEGRYDHTSTTGKLVGALLHRAQRHQVHTIVVAGHLDTPPPGHGIDLVDLAGSADAALTHPHRWLRAAGVLAARHVSTSGTAPDMTPAAQRAAQ